MAMPTKSGITARLYHAMAENDKLHPLNVEARKTGMMRINKTYHEQMARFLEIQLLYRDAPVPNDDANSFGDLGDDVSVLDEHSDDGLTATQAAASLGRLPARPTVLARSKKGPNVVIPPAPPQEMFAGKFWSPAVGTPPPSPPPSPLPPVPPKPPARKRPAAEPAVPRPKRSKSSRSTKVSHAPPELTSNKVSHAPPELTSNKVSHAPPELTSVLGGRAHLQPAPV